MSRPAGGTGLGGVGRGMRRRLPNPSAMHPSPGLPQNTTFAPQQQNMPRAPPPGNQFGTDRFQSQQQTNGFPPSGAFARASNDARASGFQNQNNDMDRRTHRTDGASSFDGRRDGGGDNRSDEPGALRIGPVTYTPARLNVEELYDNDELILAGIDFDQFENDERLRPEVTGGKHGVQPLIKTFTEAALDDRVLHNVQRLKYKKPTPIQSAAIPALLAGEDVMGCAQTGSGKTAAFLLPIITWIKNNKDDSRSNMNEPYAVIVAPTRELVKQIYREALKFANGTGVSAVEVYGQTNMRDQLERLRQGCDIVCATVGRLNHLVKEAEIYTKRIKFLILDEADRMLEQGFKEDICRLCEDQGMPPSGSRQTLMFSATFANEVQQLARDYLDKKYVMIHIGKIGAANAQVAQNVLKVSRFEKRDALKQILDEEMATTEQRNGVFSKKTLIFLKTKRMADMIAIWLSDNEVPTTSIHGDREQRQREAALRDFTTGKCLVLVATDVAARGLDIPKVDHVINYDLPVDIDQYVHRIGRTGRVGNRGRATAFYDPGEDQSLAKPLVDCMADVHQEIPDWLLQEAGVGGGGAGFGYGGGMGAHGGGGAANDWE